MWQLNQRGFSLIEILITIAIISILVAIVLSSFSSSTAVSRDAQRQSDLRMLQAAIERYKQVHGRYPEQGCGTSLDNAGTNIPVFASENASDCGNGYILGLVPEFLPKLPRDPRIGTGLGYAYLTNSRRTVFKIMAAGTVEEEISNIYHHPFKACDIIRDTSLPTHPLPSGSYVERGLCSTEVLLGNRCSARESGSAGGISYPVEMFKNSFALWGGFDIAAIHDADIYSPNPFHGLSNSQIATVARQTIGVICRLP